MSTTSTGGPESPATAGQAPTPTGVAERVYGLLGAVPTTVLWALVALWTLPTAGVFVSSFRPGIEVRTTGWWTELPNPLPDRFGRIVLTAAVIGLVVVCAAYMKARGRRDRPLDLAVAVGLPLVVVIGTLITYPEMYATVPMALALLAALLVVGGLFRLVAWVLDHLEGTARRVTGAGLALLLVAVVVALAVVGTDMTLGNYREVFDTTDMGPAFLNTVAISVPATLIPIAFAAFAAYAFAWMDFKGRHWLFIMVVAMLAVPFQMSLIPLLQLYNDGASLTVAGETIRLVPDLDLAGTPEAVWLTHIGFGLPLAIFLLHNYIASLPRDVFEAARIDGADHPTIFWRVVLPLSVPALAAFAIFQFLWVWNDYLVARTFLGSGSADAPMTIELSGLAGSRGQAWHLLTSAAFISILVPLVIFFALQRYFVRGLLAGSVKG
jgi:alpha-glucoside transport system permease protein